MFYKDQKAAQVRILRNTLTLVSLERRLVSSLVIKHASICQDVNALVIALTKRNRSKQLDQPIRIPTNLPVTSLVEKRARLLSQSPSHLETALKAALTLICCTFPEIWPPTRQTRENLYLARCFIGMGAFSVQQEETRLPVSGIIPYSVPSRYTLGLFEKEKKNGSADHTLELFASKLQEVISMSSLSIKMVREIWDISEIFSKWYSCQNYGTCFLFL